MTPIRVSSLTACKLLDISREKLRRLMINDSTFPKGYKTGTNQQAKIYFDYQALINWHNQQMELSNETSK